MSTPAELAAVVRGSGWGLDDPKGERQVALDALLAECERLQNKLNTDSQNFEIMAQREKAALYEARARRYEEVLRKIRQWDMLNPYYGPNVQPNEPTADAPYWRDVIDAALAEEEA